MSLERRERFDRLQPLRFAQNERRSVNRIKRGSAAVFIGAALRPLVRDFLPRDWPEFASTAASFSAAR